MFLPVQHKCTLLSGSLPRWSCLESSQLPSATWKQRLHADEEELKDTWPSARDTPLHRLYTLVLVRFRPGLVPLSLSALDLRRGGVKGGVVDKPHHMIITYSKSIHSLAEVFRSRCNFRHIADLAQNRYQIQHRSQVSHTAILK